MSHHASKHKTIEGVEAILPYLWTLFFEERLVALRMNGEGRWFSTILWGEDATTPPPGLEKNAAPCPGAFLARCDRLLLAPLVPVSGNMHVQRAERITLRFFACSTAVEVESRYLGAVHLAGERMLALTFPARGVIEPERRPFRAVVHETEQELALVSPLGAVPEEGALCPLRDISAAGCAFEIPEGSPWPRPGDVLRLEVHPASPAALVVEGVVRHRTRFRRRGGMTEVCGLEFDLVRPERARQMDGLFVSARDRHMTRLLLQAQRAKISLPEDLLACCAATATGP